MVDLGLGSDWGFFYMSDWGFGDRGVARRRPSERGTETRRSGQSVRSGLGLAAVFGDLRSGPFITSSDGSDLLVAGGEYGSSLYKRFCSMNTNIIQRCLQSNI